MTRYTLHLTQPDGSHRGHATGDGPGLDLDTPALPDALLRALGALYGGGWRLDPVWGGGWRVLLDDPEQGDVDVGYIDYGPSPAEPHPDQASLFAAP